MSPNLTLLATFCLFAPVSCKSRAHAAAETKSTSSSTSGFRYSASDCARIGDADAANASAKDAPIDLKKFPASYAFAPTNGSPKAGILLLHGSEGGLSSIWSYCDARRLAGQGYETMFFCYFDCGDTSISKDLTQVNLARTIDAFLWLKQTELKNTKKVALLGVSRGGEQTVLLASLASKLNFTPDAIVTHAPYGTVVGAFNWRWFDKDPRWNFTLGRMYKAGCLRITANTANTYSYSDPETPQNPPIHLEWIGGPSCDPRPALAAEECWHESTSGKYPDPTGSQKRYDWNLLCGLAPPVDESDQQPAWILPSQQLAQVGTALRLNAPIVLEDFHGPILITQGTADDVWSEEGGAETLYKRVSALAIRTVVTSSMLKSPAVLPTQKIIFEIFAGEKHVMSEAATKYQMTLQLQFLNRWLQ